MNSLVKTKGNRYIKVNFQNRDAKCFSFSQINQFGCVNGYVSGIVDKAFPAFTHTLYGDLRKFILIEVNQNNDEEDDYDDSDDEAAQLSFYTRGYVAEKCSNIRTGDIVVLEKPFVESTNKDKPVYHLVGDKKLSDISVWVIHKNVASLAVSRDDKYIADSSETNQDDSGRVIQDVDPLSEDMDVHLTNSEQHSPSVLQGTSSINISPSKGRERSQIVDIDDDVSPQRITRSTLKREKGKSSSRINRRNQGKSSSKARSRKSVVGTRSTEESDDSRQNKGEERVLHNAKPSQMRKKHNSLESRRVTRSSSSRSEQSHNSIESESHLSSRNQSKERRDKKVTLALQGSAKPSSPKSHNKGPVARRRSRQFLKRKREPSSQEEITQFSSSLDSSSPGESDSDIFAKGAHATKQKTKRKLFGHKGISSTPKDNPNITNMTMLESIKKVPAKKQVYQKDKGSHNTRNSIQLEKTGGPCDNLRSHVQPFSKASLKETDKKTKNTASSTSPSHSSNTDASPGCHVKNQRGNSNKALSPKIPSPKRVLRSQGQVASTASHDDFVMALSIRSENKGSHSPIVPLQKPILQLAPDSHDNVDVTLDNQCESISIQLETCPTTKHISQSLVSHDDDVDDEVILNIHSPKVASSLLVLRSHHIASDRADIEISQPSNEGDPHQHSEPSSPSGNFNPISDHSSKCTKHLRKSTHPRKVLKSPRAGGSPHIEEKDGHEVVDSAKNNHPSTPSGTFHPNRDKELASNSQSPKPASPAKRLRSHAKMQNADVDTIENENNDEVNSQTSSQQTTPSGKFQSKRRKLTKVAKQKGTNSEKDDEAEQQPDDTNQSSTVQKAPDELQSSENNTQNAPIPSDTHNAPNISATHDAPSISATHDAPGTSATHDATSISSAHDAPSTSATNDAPSTSATHDATTISSIHDAPRTSATNDAPSASATHGAPSTSQNAPGTVSSNDTPSTSSTHNASDGNQSSAFRVSYNVPNGYTKLSNIQLSTITNVYGVVKYFKPPWKSRGTDMCSVVVIADPSTDETLECVMFNKNAALLPQVRRIGDIVRLHRMNIKRYQDKYQALSTRGFSALVFDRDVNVPVSQDAARFSTLTFTFDSSDKDIVRTLKEWRVSLPDFFAPAKVLTASEIEPDLYFDVICQVKGVYKQKNLDCVCLKVTDGTVPIYDIKSCNDDELFEETVPLDQHQSHFTFDVYLYGDHAMLLLTLKVTNGNILFLHNVHSTAMQGGAEAGLLDVIEPTIELSVHRGSEYGRGLALLSTDSSDAQNLLQRLNQTS